MTRRGYEGIAVAVPVTVPYQRYATQGAPWFLGRVLAALVEQSGIGKDQIDGLCVSSFSLDARHRGGPDAAPGAEPALARPHPDGWRFRRGGGAPRSARGAGG